MPKNPKIKKEETHRPPQPDNIIAKMCISIFFCTFALHIIYSNPVIKWTV